MTKETLKQIAVDARIKQIQDKINEAASQGLFEIRTEILLPEQASWLKESGITYREVIQKQGTCYDISWE